MTERFLKKRLRDFMPYRANQAKAGIILDANEIPFDISDAVREKIAGLIGSDTGFNRYPDPSSEGLRMAIADKFECSPDCIVAGSGSDQMISVIANAFIDTGDRVIVPSPSFDMYRISSVIAGADVVCYDLAQADDFRYDIPKLTGMIKELSPKIVFICSPNNPTGNTMSNENIVEIIKAAADSVIVIDEAYVEFADCSFTKEAVGYDNVIVLRTFSKAYGLAGLRCGFSVSCEEMARQLLKTLPPYNLNRFTQFAAKAVLEDDDENERRILYIKNERDRIYNSISGIRGLKIYPSSANYLLVRSLDGTDLYEELIKRGIRIRKFTDKRLLEDHYRISIGSMEENDAVIKSILDVF
jgi:histidinol-phosphate aminotransferase